MGREIRLIIPVEIKDYPITLGKYVIKKKDYDGIYLNIDDGESILQIRKDNKKTKNNVNSVLWIVHQTELLQAAFQKYPQTKDRNFVLDDYTKNGSFDDTGKKLPIPPTNVLIVDEAILHDL